ncbi:MAG: hypothetical protein JO127_08070 [Caulobacteraceae bacterium]|nr:hypothetical protein [Caulobacteraceae bacterium]
MDRYHVTRTLWVFGDPLRDSARFAVWKATHAQELASARRRAGVFMHWDAWGLAGSGNDSWLASDPTDTLARPGAAGAWGRARQLGCAVVGVRRIEPGVYVLKTYDCLIPVFAA